MRVLLLMVALLYSPVIAATPTSLRGQTDADVEKSSAGCMSCHTATDNRSMHSTAAVKLGCADCHGGDPTRSLPAGVALGSRQYRSILDAAHVKPRFPAAWNYPSSANPVRSYTLLNRESPEFIRFVNPSDYRVVRESCGACHAAIIEAAVRSMHTTGVMFWGGASYNNGILDHKQYFLGESYTRDGKPAKLLGPTVPPALAGAASDAGILPELGNSMLKQAN